MNVLLFYTFKDFDIEHTWWSLFQKLVMCNKFDIYIFITITESIPLQVELTLQVWIPLGRGVHDTTLCDKVCQWLATGQWFSQGTSVSSTNKTDCHDISEIMLKVAFNTITPRRWTFSPQGYHIYSIQCLGTGMVNSKYLILKFAVPN